MSYVSTPPTNGGAGKRKFVSPVPPKGYKVETYDISRPWAVVLCSSEPRRARKKLKLCKLFAKKEERLGRERKKDDGRGFNVFWITRFSKTEIPIGHLLVNLSKIQSLKKSLSL